MRRRYLPRFLTCASILLFSILASILALAFPIMLVPHAKAAGMKVPEDVDEFDGNDFPHFHVFCNAQLGRPIPNWGSTVSDNAKVIAEIPDDKINKVTFGGLCEKGFM